MILTAKSWSQRGGSVQKRGCSMVVRDLEFATGTQGVAHPVVGSNLMLKILEVLQGRFAIVASADTESRRVSIASWTDLICVIQTTVSRDFGLVFGSRTKQE
jgi:hypothetical protein